MARKRVNRLSIYLIRAIYKDDDSILKPIQDPEEGMTNPRSSVPIEQLGNLYYEPSRSKIPAWLMKFFGNDIPNLNIYTSIAKAVLLVKVNVQPNEDRYFAVCFGHGRHLINPAAIEERFGLLTVLNAVDPNSLRRVDKKNHGATPKDAHEQVSQVSDIGAFGIDIEQDLIRGITGTAKDERFGKTFSGKDSLSVSVPINSINIIDFLKFCYQHYISQDYKEHFDWIDHIKEVKIPSLIATLDERLINRIRSDNPGHVWMAVPELIDWDDVAGFKYSQRKRNNDIVYDDIDLQTFLSQLTSNEKQNLSIDLLMKKQIHCYRESLDTVMFSWKAYNCLYSEDILNNKIYLLSNSNWYEIEKDYAKVVNDSYIKLRDSLSTCALPVYDTCGDDSYDEGDYNKHVADNDSTYYCLDRDLVSYGGGYGRVEICDLYSTGKQFIHVKRYGGSRVLSHLFAQGVVPGELFKRAADFREKVNDKLPETHKISDTSIRPKDDEYEVVYAIISSKKIPLEIPFFSKVSLRMARERLENLCGYRVSIVKVETADAQ